MKTEVGLGARETAARKFEVQVDQALTLQGDLKANREEARRLNQERIAYLEACAGESWWGSTKRMVLDLFGRDSIIPDEIQKSLMSLAQRGHSLDLSLANFRDSLEGLAENLPGTYAFKGLNMKSYALLEVEFDVVTPLGFGNQQEGWEIAVAQNFPMLYYQTVPGKERSILIPPDDKKAPTLSLLEDDRLFIGRLGVHADFSQCMTIWKPRNTSEPIRIDPREFRFTVYDS